MDNKYTQWQVAHDGPTVVESQEGMALAVGMGSAEAAWVVERLNYAARAEAQLAALGTSRLPIGPLDV
jgi:hypothetical protein